ncbi:hypothetical protein NP233_g9953 [Leucocoprinus birnbaumii]|uniref:Uncharacterized protein n=1 Tax=Leucocoprinus birnbaumii TaxID=56174 RepID=A0AAD5VJG5_9AGAR|nr:hypothetical protein NP233_g9953 [Leucocoprinus birnbaumii]
MPLVPRIPRSYNQGATDRMGSLIGVQADISKKSEAARIAQHIASLEPKGITALFNNAGIMAGQFKRPATSGNSQPTAQDFVKTLFDDVPEESFTDSFKVNAVGPYWLTVAFLPLLEKWKNQSANASANGVGTAALAHELLPLGIRVNGIAPGLFPTEMASPGTSNDLGISSVPPDREYGFESPANRSGGTRFDMGTLALFLVSNWFVNGETVLIDGGTLLRHPSSY